MAAAKEYMDEGIPHGVYYCCGPRGAYLNRFCDTPLEKIRMSGWLFYRRRALGFLHWGYNFWYVMDLGLNPTPQILIDPLLAPLRDCADCPKSEAWLTQAIEAVLATD